MEFAPHTDADVRQMLDTLGLSSIDDLFAPIPNQPALGVRFQGAQDLRPEEMLQAELGYRGRLGSFQPDIV